MAAGTLNFDNLGAPAIEQGVNFLYHFKYEDKQGNDVSLTGYTINMQVRKNFDDDLVLDLSTDNGKIIIDSNGEADISLSYTDTTDLPAGRFLYDMIITDTLDFKTKLLKGYVVIESDVTLF